MGVALLTPTIAEFSAGRKFVAGPPGMLDSAYYLSVAGLGIVDDVGAQYGNLGHALFGGLDLAG